MKTLFPSVSTLAVICLIVGSTTTSHAAGVSMPSPMVAGLIKAIFKPVKVVVKGSEKVVEKTVKVATAPVKAITR